MTMSELRLQAGGMAQVTQRKQPAHPFSGVPEKLFEKYHVKDVMVSSLVKPMRSPCRRAYPISLLQRMLEVIWNVLGANDEDKPAWKINWKMVRPPCPRRPTSQ